MASFVIVVDVGNTSATLALACGERLSRKRRLGVRGLSARVISESLAKLTRGRSVEGSVLCSVVPALNRPWLQALKNAGGGNSPMLVHHRMNLGLRIALPEPEKVGADRIANACAAAHFYGTPAIVVDFGTAVTFDVVSARNEYVGGVIAPGLPIMTDYFAERTALLPRLAWKQQDGSLRPVRGVRRNIAWGRNTVEAMLLGAEVGYLGMVREILARLRRRLGNRGVKLLATGGYARWVLSGSDLRIAIDPDLTLRGIGRIYELNR